MPAGNIQQMMEPTAWATLRNMSTPLRHPSDRIDVSPASSGDTADFGEMFNHNPLDDAFNDGDGDVGARNDDSSQANDEGHKAPSVASCEGSLVDDGLSQATTNSMPVGTTLLKITIPTDTTPRGIQSARITGHKRRCSVDDIRSSLRVSGRAIDPTPPMSVRSLASARTDRSASLRVQIGEVPLNSSSRRTRCFEDTSREIFAEGHAMCTAVNDDSTVATEIRREDHTGVVQHVNRDITVMAHGTNEEASVSDITIDIHGTRDSQDQRGDFRKFVHGLEHKLSRKTDGGSKTGLNNRRQITRLVGFYSLTYVCVICLPVYHTPV